MTRLRSITKRAGIGSCHEASPFPCRRSFLKAFKYRSFRSLGSVKTRPNALAMFKLLAGSETRACAWSRDLPRNAATPVRRAQCPPQGREPRDILLAKHPAHTGSMVTMSPGKTTAPTARSPRARWLKSYDRSSFARRTWAPFAQPLQPCSECQTFADRCSPVPRLRVARAVDVPPRQRVWRRAFLE
jgi:hypothetical protein